MDEFSYLSVLLSVILGLAVTQILKGFRGLLLSRARIRLYWPVIAWAALLLLFSTLVGDLWNANQARLDLSPIRDGASQCDFYLWSRAWSSRTFLGKKLSILEKIFTRTEAGSSRSAAARL